MFYDKQLLFCLDILWYPLFKFGANLFIKPLLNIQLISREFYATRKGIGYCRFINIKRFFVFCVYVNFWYDFRTGVRFDICKLKRAVYIHIYLLGIEYKFAFFFLCLKKRSCK